LFGAKGGVKDPDDFVKRASLGFQSLGVQAQVVDSRFVVDEVHISLAYTQASRRFSRGEQISRSLPMEFLLYLAGTHQINVAIDRLGIKPDTEEMLFVVLEAEGREDLSDLFEELGIEPSEEPVFARDLKTVLEAFGIPPSTADGSDPDAAKKAVHESVGMVNLEK
jgi:tRNA threonylcarbamoyladenosine modification (KEOPS) complex Cgi121 subunit